ncbi:MAG: hypothetical protein PHX25_01290 [Candidatus Pacebacteria bacterium]|nr:hypothetical protein [Candidatus Paceibacterota bacterium]
MAKNKEKETEFCKITEVDILIIATTSLGEEIEFNNNDVCDLCLDNNNFITCFIKSKKGKLFFESTENPLIKILVQTEQKIRKNKKASLSLLKEFLEERLRERNTEIKSHEDAISNLNVIIKNTQDEISRVEKEISEI